MSTKHEQKQAKKEQYYSLTRWRYFVKSLYGDVAKSGKFDFQGERYYKDDALLEIEDKSNRLHLFLVVLMMALIFCAIQFQRSWLLGLALVLIVAGEIVRIFMLPRDIKAHLTQPKFDKRVEVVADDEDDEE